MCNEMWLVGGWWCGAGIMSNISGALKVDVRISGQFFQLRTVFYLSDFSLVDGLLQVRFCSSKQ